MFLLKAKKVFIKKMTILTLILSVVIGLIYHLFIPDRYFPWFPAIPVFFYLFGLFYINMFSLAWFHCFWFAKEQSFLSVC